MDIETSLRTANLSALRTALSGLDHCPTVKLGDANAPALHALCHHVFEQTISQDDALPMAQALLDHGADPNEVFAQNGDSVLISAVSLSCDAIANLLLDRGADAAHRGVFGSTAIHWAAIMGMPNMTNRLIPVSDLELEDLQYQATPLDWAVQGAIAPPPGAHKQSHETITTLIAAGSPISSDWATNPDVSANAALKHLLRL